jgi:hypothetical protein
MDKKSLEDKKSSLEQQFNSINDKNKQLNLEIQANNEELFKLAGEFRLVEELLINLSKEGSKK